MVKLRVQLSEEHSRAVRCLAQEEGRSIAEIVRESLDALLRARWPGDREELKRRSLASLGTFHSGLGDLATHHDHYLAESYPSESTEGGDR